jgi:hypothetical protein
LIDFSTEFCSECSKNLYLLSTLFTASLNKFLFVRNSSVNFVISLLAPFIKPLQYHAYLREL